MASDDITIENLRQLLHIQTELREQAETRGRKAQRVLVGLLETFAPDEVDQRLKSGRPLDSLPVEELVQKAVAEAEQEQFSFPQPLPEP